MPVRPYVFSDSRNEHTREALRSARWWSRSPPGRWIPSASQSRSLWRPLSGKLGPAVARNLPVRRSCRANDAETHRPSARERCQRERARSAFPRLDWRGAAARGVSAAAGPRQSGDWGGRHLLRGAVQHYGDRQPRRLPRPRSLRSVSAGRHGCAHREPASGLGGNAMQQQVRVSPSLPPSERSARSDRGSRFPWNRVTRPASV